MSADTLPPLPQPEFFWQREVHRSDRFTRIDGYTAVQMHAYALAALAAKPPDARDALCHPAPALLEVPLAPAVKRGHIASADCWCGPEVEYVDPDTGNRVLIHKDIQ